MLNIKMKLLFCFLLFLATANCLRRKKIFDFTSVDSLENWVENSDTKSPNGRSKADFVLQQTEVFQRAVLFTLIIPQLKEQGVAGFECRQPLDLSAHKSIAIKQRARGDLLTYRVHLKQNGQYRDDLVYQQNFTGVKDFAYSTLQLTDFQPFLKGRPAKVEEVGLLDTSKITSISIQLAGGYRYYDYTDPLSGVQCLEIEDIVAF